MNDQSTSIVWPWPKSKINVYQHLSNYSSTRIETWNAHIVINGPIQSPIHLYLPFLYALIPYESTYEAYVEVIHGPGSLQARSKVVHMVVMGRLELKDRVKPKSPEQWSNLNLMILNIPSKLKQYAVWMAYDGGKQQLIHA